MSVLAIDGGASATKWRLEARDGSRVASGVAGPAHGHVFDNAARAASEAALRLICSEAVRQGPVEIAAAGLSGLGWPSDAARWLEGLLRDELGLPGDAVLVSDDLWLVYLGLMDPGKGLLMYAGTGAIGYHLATDCRIVRAGGYGYMIDDAGGGFWIGRQAVRRWLRRLESGDTSETFLGNALAARFGTGRWEDIRPRIYSGGRNFVASMTREVLGAAKQGDEDAIEILEQAGAELGRLCGRLFRAVGLGAVEMSLVGGIANCLEFVEAPMIGELPDGIVYVPRDVDGAAAICTAVSKYGLGRLAAMR